MSPVHSRSEMNSVFLNAPEQRWDTGGLAIHTDEHTSYGSDGVYQGSLSLS